MKRWLICILFWTFLLEVAGIERPKLATLDPDIQQWYQECSQQAGCKIILRNVKLLGTDKMWISEPVLILRTSQVIDMSLMRFKGTNFNYLVLMLPDSQIDQGLLKLIGGK